MRTYNLFISHSWAYSDTYENLNKMLSNRPYFNFNNYSVPKNDPIHNAGTDHELELAIKAKVKPCSVIIILAGVYSSYSKWIQKEIRIANSLDKKIIAIEPWGSQKTSVTVKQNAQRIVGWNTDSIIKAIRDLA